MRSIGRIAMVLCILMYMVSAAGVADTTYKGRVSLSGSIELEMAEMVEARTAKTTNPSGSGPIDHAWYNHLIGTLNFDAQPVENLTLRGSFEFRQYNNMSPTLYQAQYNLGDFLYHAFYVREAQGIYSLINNSSLSMDIAAGLMPYKYNTDAKDLGEYLFRSGTYPFYITTDFNRPFARLTGIRTDLKYSNTIMKSDVALFALTERETRPFWDISFAAVAHATFFKYSA